MDFNIQMLRILELNVQHPEIPNTEKSLYAFLKNYGNPIPYYFSFPL